MVWWWFGANMAGLRNIRNTNAFKFILQVFILSQKHILGVKKVVWCGLDVVWGGLGWFGVFPRTAITESGPKMVNLYFLPSGSCLFADFTYIAISPCDCLH